VAQTTRQIEAKAREIGELAKQSATPLSLMSLHCTVLLGQDDWTPEEVERVSGEVVTLLIRGGWKVHVA